ncbi:MAG: hypothetical protein IKJ94_05990 [Oscillospiraceae bacterium]|nr:hypothetical protein [Oscillospiraceae bacterium]
MLKNLRKITSLLLVMTLVVLFFGPASANAATIGASNDKKDAQVIYRAVGSSVSAKMRESLSDFSISVKENTELEIVKAKDEEGTILYATTREGALVTQSALMAIGDNGELKTFTAEDVVTASSNFYGEGADVNPFNNSFQISFSVSFYAYSYGSDRYGIIRPKLAMFMYKDPNNLYTISELVMNYDCYGVLGEFDGTNIDTSISDDGEVTRYRITKAQTNPARNTYYSRTREIASNRALLMYGGDCMQEIAYTLVGVRNSTGASFDITDYVMVDVYF